MIPQYQVAPILFAIMGSPYFITHLLGIYGGLLPATDPATNLYKYTGFRTHLSVRAQRALP